MTYLIAEAGTGYAGNDKLRIALFCAETAKKAGADAVKFQLFIPNEDLFCPLDGDEVRWKRWADTHMSLDEWFKVRNRCEALKIDFLASVFQPTAIQWLRELNPRYYKVASRAAMTYPYEDLPGPFIISTGRGPQLNLMNKARFFLDCVMKYPTPLASARWGGRRAGLSDHSGTVYPGLDAIFRGADFLEVHFAVPGMDPGRDAAVCLNFDDLNLLAEARDAAAVMCQD